MNNNRGYKPNNNININNVSDLNIPGGLRDTEEYMYPEVYHKFAPIADKMIKDMEKQYGEVVLSEDLLQQMTNEAMRRAGIDTNDANMMPGKTPRDGDAVPTMYEFGHHGGYGRDGHGGGYWHGRDGYWNDYGYGPLSDIFRILFLQQIFGRHRPNWKWR